MKSSLQVKWYGVLISSKNTFPKYLYKKCSVFSAANIALTPFKKDAKKLKANIEKNVKEAVYFEITDKQFGQINITYGKKIAVMPAYIKRGISLKEKWFGNTRNIAIPVTELQMQNGWSL